MSLLQGIQGLSGDHASTDTPGKGRVTYDNHAHVLQPWPITRWSPHFPVFAMPLPPGGVASTAYGVAGSPMRAPLHVRV